jgi:ribonuclease P protein component
LGEDGRREPSQKPNDARLLRRADFQRAARGRRAQTAGFTLQANRRADEAGGPHVARVGFTVTKKIGNSVVRNRIRRRLREAIRLAGALEARPDHDYVVMARREALARPFEALISDLTRAFVQVLATGKPGRHFRSARTTETSDHE